MTSASNGTEQPGALGKGTVRPFPSSGLAPALVLELSISTVRFCLPFN